MSNCPTIPTGGAFLGSLLEHVDCQAQMIGAGGYQALANPGSSTSIALTALLTIFTAILGIRMLMGHSVRGGELISITLTIGVVLLLAGSWSAYRVIAYDLVLRGPAEIAAGIGGGAELPASDGGLAARLQRLDNKIIQFSVFGTGRFDIDANSTNPAAKEIAPLGRVPVNDDFAFGLGRLAFLVGTVGVLAAIRLAAGLFLALAPLFAGLLLFEGTRGFFFGWVRALAGVALAAATTAVALGVQLNILEPWLSHVLSLRQARIPTPAAPVELVVINLAFAFAIAAIAALCVRAAFNPHFPRISPKNWKSVANQASNRRGNEDEATRAIVSRAQVISETLASQRRESVAFKPVLMSSKLGHGVDHESGVGQSTSASLMPPQHRQPSRRRISLVASQRRRKV